MIDWLLQSYNNHLALWLPSLCATVIGMVSGALGSFAVLRKQSLLGDAISHAAFPGIVIAFMLTRSKAPLVLVVGAALAGWLATLTVMSILRTTRCKSDTALGLVLSVFFGVGILLESYTQKHFPDARQAGLNDYLFGDAAGVTEHDLVLLGVLGGGAVILMLLFWKEFKLLVFDPDFGASQGYPILFLDVLLTSLLVVAIVIGLQMVGAVLMSALLVAPSVAARQWTDRLGWMVVLAGLLGALAGLGGAMISINIRRMPTGPVIVICATVLVVFSILLAPNRGLLWAWGRQVIQRRRLRLDAVLSDLYELARQHDSLEHGHSLAVLRAMSVGRAGLDRTLQELAKRGWARQVAPDSWTLTPDGYDLAKEKVQNR